MSSFWQSAFRALQEEPPAPPAGLALRGSATLLASLYGLGAWGRRALYDRGWLPTKRLPAPVLSLGNLAVGGTGKTPLTAWLARHYQERGCRVAILSRGYGGQASGVNVISDGRRIFLQPPQAGDEAYLLARTLPGVSIFTGAERYQAGMRAWEAGRPDLFILDDGFQHFQLWRDLDVVLLDAARPFGNGCLLPRGPLREPLRTLRRPRVLILTRYVTGRHENTWEAIRKAFPAAQVLRAAFGLTDAIAFPGSATVRLAALARHNLAALAGVARPEDFAARLKQADINLSHFFPFPDHHAFTPGELAAVVAQARRSGAVGLLTTEKDWARLGEKWSFDLPLYVVPLRVDFLDPWPEDLLPLTCVESKR